ncbi:MAG: response regulator, partial [Peptococcaceae bacterium]|nr:response regulator [Peptococcaceae bacterium]
MYIAVCEDQKDLANSLRRDIESYFENRGEPLVAVREYYDGQALLDADAVQPFDIIFMDIELPGISGMETAKALRQRGSDA